MFEETRFFKIGLRFFYVNTRWTNTEKSIVYCITFSLEISESLIGKNKHIGKSF